MITQEEKKEEKKIINFARGNVRYEGVILSPEIEILTKKYINGEIDKAEHSALGMAQLMKEFELRKIKLIEWFLMDSLINTNFDQQLSESKSFFRISEVLENSSLVPGRFDDQHLKDLHAYIFQDSPEHKPGITRSNTKDIWFKDRELEALPDSDGNLVPQPKHPVAYVNKNIGKELQNALKNNNIEKLAQLPQEEFSQKLTDLYSKLDYVHPFHEGNSRTLRTFTSLMAESAGYDLDWNTTNVSPQSRNELYNARDLAVYNHFYNGKLSDEFTKKHPFNNNAEYYIAMKSNAFKKQQEQLNSPQLNSIISNSLTKIEQPSHTVNSTLEKYQDNSKIKPGAISNNNIENNTKDIQEQAQEQTPTIKNKGKGLGL